ncbi:ABC transporter permease [Crateriforma spongiae]|uniref:ABC transporter permease n=1 Tax=Crateriforma spongiae TaxID=2724528 RepID=UPI001F1BCD1C|nr:FtsX-like permease family protein [Crateriforma spongiae]
MSLIRIAWRNFRFRTLSSLLTTLSLALGVGLVVLVLSIYGIISEAFVRNASVGPNLVVGAAGSGLQLTLNSIFYLSQPIENLDYTDYMDFMSQAQRAEQVERFGGDPSLAEDDGKYYDFLAGGYAIPLALGDYYGTFRLVGTTPDFFEKLRFGPMVDQEFTFRDGRAFVTESEDHGYFEAVLGSRVAAEMGINVGDVIYPTHGDPEGKQHDEAFTVVGVMNPTGTPNDRAAFINLEGFYLMKGHAKPVDSATVFENTLGESVKQAIASEFDGDLDDAFVETMTDQLNSAVPAAAQTAKDAVAAAELKQQQAQQSAEVTPLSIPEREITALLIRNGNLMFAPMMQNMIKETKTRQAVAPIGEINKLMGAIVGPLLTALMAITLLTCIVAAVGILVAIYNSMNDRRKDIAIMRALGARRGTVTTIILMESLIIALIGGIVGWVSAHAAIFFASGYIESQTGIQVGFLSTSKMEIAVLPLVLILALLAGLLPAWSAYRTDAGSNLSA